MISVFPDGLLYAQKCCCIFKVDVVGALGLFSSHLSLAFWGFFPGVCV